MSNRYVISVAGIVHVGVCVRALGRSMVPWDPESRTARFAVTGACNACLPQGLPPESGQPWPAISETRKALSREIGPATDRDHTWNPMVSAGEIRQLLYVLDVVEDVARTADALGAGVAPSALIEAVGRVNDA